MILLCLVTSLYLVNCQVQYTEPQKIKPEKCYGEDNVMNRRCCIFPPFFKLEEARSCGALSALVEMNDQHNVTILRRDINSDCEFWKCLLRKYSMLDSGRKLILENYFSHLDRWSALNPSFVVPLGKAKMYCQEFFKLYFPLTPCEFFDFQQCIRRFVNVHCPLIIPSKECAEWKEFYLECKEFFI